MPAVQKIESHHRITHIEQSLITAAPASSTIVPITLTPEKVFVPKQNDLIFIEFFAIT